MKWTNLFIPTTREVPAGAEAISHQLLLRAGYIRQVGAGLYAMLPLAQRMRLKIMDLIRSEMNAINGQEFMLTALQPAEVWKESGRWQSLDEIAFRLRDRKNAEMLLGLTHEEAFTALARNGLNSYKQLPQIWYQIQTKFRDEARPKSGLLRVREFTMKDAYSFDFDEAGLDKSFEAHRHAYQRIFDRCGLKYTAVDASSGAMGGSKSTEFMVLTDAGEDNVVLCDSCDYAANTEKAFAKFVAHQSNGDGNQAVEEFATPGIRTIDQLANFGVGAAASNQIKTLVFVLDDKLTLILMRGDHELNETKLQAATGAQKLRPAVEVEIVEAMGARPGSLGAVGLRASEHKQIDKILADSALKGRTGMFTGANKDDWHLRGVDLARDLSVDLWEDFRLVKEGDDCAQCNGKLKLRRALEIGHIFKLGTRYSETMNAHVLDEKGERRPIIMGSYGIGVERLIGAIAELSHDEHGLIWPQSVAPFDVIIVPTNVSDAQAMESANALHDELTRLGLDVLLDDRDERAGVKFKDADLIGIPVRVTFGKKVKEGIVELRTRNEGVNHDVALEGLASDIEKRLKAN